MLLVTYHIANQSQSLFMNQFNMRKITQDL